MQLVTQLVDTYCVQFCGIALDADVVEVVIFILAEVLENVLKVNEFEAEFSLFVSWSIKYHIFPFILL